MKFKYRVALAFVAMLLMFIGGKARAVQLEIGVGQVTYKPSNDTDWWQSGPASEGFSTNFNLTTSSYRVGIFDYISPSVRYRIGYANLGNVSMKSRATNYDHEYDLVNHRCAASGCEMVTYSGIGSVDGYYATLAPEVLFGKWAVYGEVGVWAYFPKFSMTKYDDRGGSYQVPVNSGTETGPVFGFGIRHENMSLGARFYKVDHNGQLPAIYQGFASEVSLEWSFK